MSPLIRTGSQRSAKGVPEPKTKRGIRSGCSRSCGFLNRSVPVSRSGLTAIILQPRLLRLLQRGQHPGMIGPGVVAHDEDGLRPAGKIAQLHAALADPEHRRQGHAGRLVAHVGAVGQVVRAEGPDKKLIEKRRLVAGPPRGIEKRLMRAIRPALSVPSPNQPQTSRPSRSARNDPNPAAAPSARSAGPDGPANGPTAPPAP